MYLLPTSRYKVNQKSFQNQCRFHIAVGNQQKLSSKKMTNLREEKESESESIFEKEMCDRDWKNQLPSAADARNATLPMTCASTSLA